MAEGLPTTQFEFPLVDDYDVLDSTFFRYHALNELPTPDRVRCSQGVSFSSISKRFLRPSVIFFRDLGLAVKYGHHVSVAEAHCLLFLRKHCPTVPVPEIFAWRRNRRQTFLYMELIDGIQPQAGGTQAYIDSLERQLTGLVQTLQSIPQTLVSTTPFVGHVNGGPLRSWVFINSAKPVAGPWTDATAFHDWLATDYGNGVVVPGPQEIEAKPLSTSAEQRKKLADDLPIVLTHGDLRLCNLILDHTVQDDGLPRIRAVVDWAQAGWLPQLWECAMTRGFVALKTGRHIASRQERTREIVSISKEDTTVAGESIQDARSNMPKLIDRVIQYTEAVDYFTLRAAK